MQKIRKGDDVIVTTGKDKGKRGTELRRMDNKHLLVEGINRARTHQKRSPRANPDWPTASVSRRWRTAARCAFSSPTAKSWTPERENAMARLYSYYKETVVPDLVKKFGYKTAMQVPRIEKITLNMGVGEAVNDKKIMDNAVGDMTKIAGQKPVVTLDRKSVVQTKR